MDTWLEDNDLDESLLQRYCSDTASAEEATRIEAWFRKHQDQRVWYEQFKTSLRRQTFSPPSEAHLNGRLAEFVRAALQLHPASYGEQEQGVETSFDTANLTRHTFPEESGERPQTFRSARQREEVFSGQPLRRRTWYTLAGIIVGVTVVIAGWYTKATDWSASRQTAASTYETANGERARITLPDGNTVALNVASRLDVPADYMSGNHTLHLAGEALFNVVHHTGSPFTVIAGTTAVRVLGTSFTVRHYVTDTSVSVAVREGKVEVGKGIVTANTMLEVERHGGIRLSDAGPAAFSFAKGTLVLHRIRLRDAIADLDRWYNADIRLGNASLGQQLFDGEYAAGSLSELESILALTFDVRVVRDGRVLTLLPK